MKKALFAIFVVCLQMGLLGCGGGEPPEPPVLEPFYINNSGVTVKLIVKDVRVDLLYPVGEQEIENNDTLCNQYLDESCSNSYWFVTRDSENGWNEGILGHITYFRIEFLTKPKVCLFYGNTKVENDIRYWENYTLIKNRGDVHYYSYTITPEHKAKAKEEDCPSSIGE